MATATRPARPTPAEPAPITGDYREDAELLRAAIAATPDPREGKAGPIPAILFASSVALVNPRTLRRYLAGERPLPPLLREKCDGIVEAVREAERRKRSRAAKLGRRRRAVAK